MRDALRLFVVLLLNDSDQSQEAFKAERIEWSIKNGYEFIEIYSDKIIEGIVIVYAMVVIL